MKTWLPRHAPPIWFNDDLYVIVRNEPVDAGNFQRILNRIGTAYPEYVDGNVMHAVGVWIYWIWYDGLVYEIDPLSMETFLEEPEASPQELDHEIDVYAVRFQAPLFGDCTGYHFILSRETETRKAEYPVVLPVYKPKGSEEKQHKIWVNDAISIRPDRPTALNREEDALYRIAKNLHRFLGLQDKRFTAVSDRDRNQTIGSRPYPTTLMRLDRPLLITPELP